MSEKKTSITSTSTPPANIRGSVDVPSSPSLTSTQPSQPPKPPKK